jgi:hypothetical protein
MWSSCISISNLNSKKSSKSKERKKRMMTYESLGLFHHILLTPNL